jgi:hypothetical protein
MVVPETLEAFMDSLKLGKPVTERYFIVLALRDRRLTAHIPLRLCLALMGIYMA